MNDLFGGDRARIVGDRTQQQSLALDPAQRFSAEIPPNDFDPRVDRSFKRQMDRTHHTDGKKRNNTIGGNRTEIDPENRWAGSLQKIVGRDFLCSDIDLCRKSLGGISAGNR